MDKHGSAFDHAASLAAKTTPMPEPTDASDRRHATGVRPQAVFMGGTLSQPTEIAFAERLGAAMIARTGLAVVVSGYRGMTAQDADTSPTPSFGFCIARGAQRECDADDGSRIFTQISPAPDEADQYFSIGQVVHPGGKSRQAQQLSVVLASAVVCLAGGGSGTRTLYDFALGLDRPVLPLPFFGGAAKTIWRRHRHEIGKRLGLDKAAVTRWTRLMLVDLSDDEMAQLAEEVAACLAVAVRKRCLVFMPFASDFDWVLDELIAPAATKAAVDLVRIDLQDYVGDIVGMFERELALADLTLAIVTGDSPNVFYEIGYAHAVGKPVLFLCEKGVSTLDNPETPFYIRNHRTVWYPARSDVAGVRRGIDDLAVALRHLVPVQGER